MTIALGSLLPLASGRPTDPFAGIGEPEPLKSNLAGLWSRQIDNQRRLVYEVERKPLYIIQCRFHY